MLFRKKYCYFMILGSSYSLTHSRNQSFNHSFRCSDFYICFDFQWINIAGYKPKTQVQLMQRSPSNSKKTSKPTSSRFLLFCSEHLNCPKSMNPKIVLRLLSKIKRILGQWSGIALAGSIYCAGGKCSLFNHYRTKRCGHTTTWTERFGNIQLNTLLISSLQGRTK